MDALVVDHATTHGLRVGQVPEPEPAPHEAVVRVSAFSINYGDITDVVANAADGEVPGWEAAGVVTRAAADGTGPAVGTPVVSFAMAGGWAQLRAVSTDSLGVLPHDADFGAAATVPIAGVSALAALHRLGPLLGRRVLITGATGGVGRYAVQLARLGGAEVIALTGQPDAHGDELRRLGADRVVASVLELDQLDGVVDCVGGPALVQAFDRLARNGTLVSVGHVTGEAETFAYGSLISGPGRDNRTLASFFMPEAAEAARSLGLARSMTWLAAQVTAGVLDPSIAWRGGWHDVDDAVGALLGRRLHGKAVIDL